METGVIENNKTERYPSVSQILKATESPDKQEGLRKWRESVGEEEAERIRTASKERGIRYDQMVEDHYDGKPIEHKALERFLKQYPSVHSREENVISHRFKYFGRYDIIWEKGVLLVLNDFKGSAKPKRQEYLGDYLLQVSAYVMALREMGIQVAYAMITVILDDDVQYPFILDNEEILYNFGLFLNRLDQYNAMQN